MKNITNLKLSKLIGIACFAFFTNTFAVYSTVGPACRTGEHRVTVWNKLFTETMETYVNSLGERSDYVSTLIYQSASRCLTPLEDVCTKDGAKEVCSPKKLSDVCYDLKRTSGALEFSVC